MSNRHNGPGEGTVYLRADGRWSATYSLGNRKRKTVYAATERDVRRKLNLALREQAAGLPASDDRLSVRRFLDQWLQEVAKPSVRPKTYRGYAQVVRDHLVPELGAIKLSKVAPADVQRLLSRKLSEGHSPRYVAYMRVVLRIALGRALKWGMVSRNAAALADPPKVSRYAITPLTPDEARTFLAAVSGDRLYPLYVLALTTGLREGELLGLAWDDIDLGRSQARVHQQLQRVDGRLQLTDPKTSASRHTVTLAGMAVDALTEHSERRKFERAAAEDRWQETGLVFTTRLGTPLEPRNVVRGFKAALKKAGLRDRRFHDLRHSCASLLLAEGVPAKVVAEMLGHSTIRLTLDTYSHVVPALQQEAANRFDVLLGPPRSQPVKIPNG